jgi:hypothetical protein
MGRLLLERLIDTLIRQRLLYKLKKLHSVAFSPQANYTGRATAVFGEVSANFCG